MSDQHVNPPGPEVEANIPPDEDDAVHLATEGIPDRDAAPDPDAFRPDVEVNDEEDGS